MWVWQQGTSPLLNIFTYRLESKLSPPILISDCFRNMGKRFLKLLLQKNMSHSKENMVKSKAAVGHDALRSP